MSAAIPIAIRDLGSRWGMLWPLFSFNFSDFWAQMLVRVASMLMIAAKEQIFKGERLNAVGLYHSIRSARIL